MKESSFSLTSNITTMASSSTMENTYVPRNLRMMYRSRILNIVMSVFDRILNSETSVELRHHFGFPIVEVSGLYVLARFPHEPQIEGEIVD